MDFFITFIIDHVFEIFLFSFFGIIGLVFLTTDLCRDFDYSNQKDHIFKKDGEKNYISEAAHIESKEILKKYNFNVNFVKDKNYYLVKPENENWKCELLGKVKKDHSKYMLVWSFEDKQIFTINQISWPENKKYQYAYECIEFNGEHTMFGELEKSFMYFIN